MPLTPDQAADIARRHGLTLNDAAGLLSLAEDEADADRIAARFASSDPAAARDAELRAYAGHLFGRTPATDDTADDDPPPQNVSRKEGTTAHLPDDERELRRFVADLFDHPTRHDL